MNSIQYLGFDVNGREVEEWLGDAFETHLPSTNQIVLRQDAVEIAVNAGEKIHRTVIYSVWRDPS